MKQGIYRITNDEYHNSFCDEPTLSTGVIKKLLDCPKRAWTDSRILNPKYVKPEHERSFDLGSAVHDYVLEGGNAIEVIKDFKDWRKEAAKDLAKSAWDAGKIPLLEKQFEQVQEIAASVMAAIRDCSELGIIDLKTDGVAELTYLWEEDGIWMKARPDWISADKKLILDLKSTTSADPNEFSRKVTDLGYSIQSSLYRRGCGALNGIGPEFCFVVVEISPPYLCSIVSLSPEFQELGNQQVETAINLWRRCLKTGKWPGYRTDRICWLEPKPWAIAAWSEKKYDLERMIDNN